MKHSTAILQPIATPEMIGESPSMQKILQTIKKLAPTTVTVLINGESGTGKELIARALHSQSHRAEKPFIAINMAAIPRELMESELFGHERGAFTGAHNRREGRFEQANGGTLFLDEIGDMPLEMQTRLLRVLAEGEFYPVGAQIPVKVDVRIITATHQKLEICVAEGRFREDLYYRLNVIRIQLPPLRNRSEDIPKLLKHFLQKSSILLNEKCKNLCPETEKHLCDLDWPGNIRQLENFCYWLTVMVPSQNIKLCDLPHEQLQTTKLCENVDWQKGLHQWVENQLETGAHDVAKQVLFSAEKVLILSALQQSRGRRYIAAQRLGYSRNTLTRKMREYNL